MAKKHSWFSKIVLLVILLGAAGFLAYVQTQQFATKPLALAPSPVLFTVENGDGLNKVLPKMRAAGIVQGADWQWKLLALQMDMASRIHVGDYQVDKQTTPAALLHKLAIGDTARVKFTLVEGWNFKQLLAQMGSITELQDDVAGKSNIQLMEMIGRKGLYPEGRFLPDTYFVPLSGRKSQILHEAAKAMDTVLAAAWVGRDSGLPLSSPEQLLILASIVEKETGQAHERPQIAGVFIRRLKLGMRLQTDPTVIYGMGDSYQGNIRKQDLRTDTPYNTYTRYGLPPTPIAMPGRAALQASAHPAAGDALYFVANGNGEHLFSATYAEHKKAVKTYQVKK